VSQPSGIGRRGFLRTTVAGTALLSVFRSRPAANGLAVSLVADPSDRIASSPHYKSMTIRSWQTTLALMDLVKAVDEGDASAGSR